MVLSVPYPNAEVAYQLRRLHKNTLGRRSSRVRNVQRALTNQLALTTEGQAPLTTRETRK